MKKRKNRYVKIGKILNSPVVHLPDGKNYLSWAELTHGGICWGSSSAGKTSGVGNWVLNDILRDKTKPGLIILCVKPTERNRIEQMVKRAGRSEDLVIFSKDNPYTINVLENELLRNGRQNPNYENAVDLLIELSSLAENYQAGGSSGNGSDDRYWVTSLKLRLKRLLMLLVISGARISVTNMRRAMIDSFSEEDVVHYADIWRRMKSDDQNVASSAIKEYEDWYNNNYFLQLFETANTREDLSQNEIEILQLVGDYFLKEYPFISDKTRSIIDSSVSALVEPFTTGILHTHCDGETSQEMKPENCYKNGAIQVIDVSLAEEGLDSILVMGSIKKSFQLCQQRRRVEEEENPRPVVIWIDEYHLVANATSDTKFQSICRDTFTACFYLTQSINLIKSVMGNMAEVKTKSLLANLGTVFTCRSTCRDTNTYIADLIGKGFIKMKSSSLDTNDRGSRSTSEQLNYIVPPEHMTTLKSGGESAKYIVESICVVGGKKWSTNENFLECNFDQRGRQKSILKRIFSFIKSLFYD